MTITVLSALVAFFIPFCAAASGAAAANRRWIRAAKTGELVTNDAGVFRVEKMTLADPDPPGRERRPSLGVVFMQRVARRAFG